jgi:ABC-2 type transport system ATP-binding protein
MSVNSLGVHFGSVAAVRDVSLHVDEGEIVVILGPNGAGKTTTTETLLGFRRPTSGSVTILGVDPYAQRDVVTTNVGALLQRGGVWAPMTPREVLELSASYYPTARSPRELEERLGLTSVATTPWRRLSGGEQQRTLLALALLGSPTALVLDEPTSAVDPEGHQVIRRLLNELRSEGCAILVTTHQLADAEEIADRVVIMKNGSVVAEGTLASLQGEATTVIEVSGEVTVEGLARAFGCTVTNDGRGRYRMTGASPSAGEIDRVLRDLGAELLSLRNRATLEERYLDIVSDEVGS